MSACGPAEPAETNSRAGDAASLPDVGSGDSQTSAVCGDGQATVAAGELCDGDEVDCTSLAASYGGGRAACRADCSGYDVRACKIQTAQAGVEGVHPALRDPRWKDARCNDGSPFAFRVSLSPTKSDTWVIDLEGGGFCDGTINTCRPGNGAQRSPDLVTSKGEPADRDLGASTGKPAAAGTLLSRDPTANPTFADANLVYAHYCSSDVWSGTRTATTHLAEDDLDVYFAGRLNARALIEILRQRFGMDDQRDTLRVLLTGESAGGVGTQTNADVLAHWLPRAQAGRRLWIAPSAGFMPLRWNNPAKPVAAKYSAGALGLSDIDTFESLTKLYQSEFSAQCRALVAAAGGGLGDSACAAGLFATRSIYLPPPTGLGLRLLVSTNRRDPIYAGSLHGLVDAEAPIAEWDALVASEMLESGVRWLFAPNDGPVDSLGKLDLRGHLLYPFWGLPFRAFDTATDACHQPYPASMGDFRTMMTAFFNDTAPDTSSTRVCFNGPWRRPPP